MLSRQRMPLPSINLLLASDSKQEIMKIKPIGCLKFSKLLDSFFCALNLSINLGVFLIS